MKLNSTERDTVKNFLIEEFVTHAAEGDLRDFVKEVLDSGLDDIKPYGLMNDKDLLEELYHTLKVTNVDGLASALMQIFPNEPTRAAELAEYMVKFGNASAPAEA